MMTIWKPWEMSKILTIDNNKILNLIIVDDDDNLKSLGIEKVSIINKNVIIKLPDGQTIFCKFKMDNLDGTLQRLNKKLIDKGINGRAIERLELLLTDKILQRIDELEGQKEDSASTTDIPKIKEEIEKDRISIGQISAEEWQAKLVEKYENLQETVRLNLPNLWSGLEFVLSAKSILKIKDCTLPFAGILLGSPSSLKTVGIELFRKWPQTYYTDNFSAKSFVSHSTAVTKEQLEEIDMLPKIRNKLFLTPELAPTFATRDDDLIQILAIMTRVLDGHGYESDSGAHGHRGYNEKMMFVWIGAAVDIPYKVHRYLGTLGPKLYFLRLPKSEKKTEDDYMAQINSSFDQKVKEIEKALFEYLHWFEMYPNSANQSSLSKIEWNSDKDNVDAKRYVIRLAQLLAYLRGVVSTWHTRDTQGSNYGYGMAIKEECDRAIQQLYNLARGHALSQGRNYITLEDIPLIIKVVLSTASIERVTIFDLLLAYKGTMTTTQIATSLNISQPTALRTMTELKALGLVEMVNGDSNTPAKITLDPQFSWVFDKEFVELRNGFVPSDNSEYMKKERKEKYPLSSQKNENSDSSETKDEDDEVGYSGTAAHKEKYPPTHDNLSSPDQQHKEKISSTTENNDNLSNDSSRTDSEPKKLEIKFTPDYEAGKPMFLRVFEELAKDNNGLVHYDKLHESLVSTGKFFVGEAVLMIEHMEKIGEIEQTEQYHIYKRRIAASPE
jgi:Mn-dependent DtxR family transcriptional regulator